MTEKSALPAWVWPIKLDDYDRNPELNVEEAETLRANLPNLANGVPPSIVIEKCGLARLMKPLEDVCTHIELQRKYWPNLKALMMRNRLMTRVAEYPVDCDDPPLEIRSAAHGLYGLRGVVRSAQRKGRVRSAERTEVHLI